MTPSSITVSFPLGLFGSATMNVPAVSGAEEVRLPLDRELLDMPNVVPDSEGMDECSFLDEV